MPDNQDYSMDAGPLHVEIRADGSVLVWAKERMTCPADMTRDEFRVLLSAILMVGLDRWYNPPFKE